MIYIDPTPNASGAYPNPKNQSFPGCISLTDEQAATFFEYNGFVTVEQKDDDVAIVPNTEAWDAWKAELPPEAEPEPTIEERIATLEAKNEALTTSNQFLEDCLVEMANMVYA